MTTPRSRSSKKPSSDERPTRKRNTKAKRAGDRASDAVQVAGDVLAEELDAGIESARPVAERFRDEQRVDPDELGKVVARARTDIHELVDMVDDRMKDLQSEDVQALSGRLLNDAHDVADLLMDLLGAVPALVDRAAAATDTATD